jgi:hypothetical protein
MSIYWIVAYISIAIWIFPPFKQLKTEYFYFFLVLALTDVIAFLFTRFLHINPQLTYLFSALFLVISLVKLNKIKIVLLSSLVSILIFICSKNDSKLLFVLYALFSFAILLIILYQFMQYLINKNSISIFFVFLIAYELSLVLKNIVYYTNLIQGVTLFSITTLFEIVFGIIFTFVNINTKVYKLPVKDIE